MSVRSAFIVVALASAMTLSSAFQMRPNNRQAMSSLSIIRAAPDPDQPSAQTGGREFWINQQALLEDLGAIADKSQRKEDKQTFAKRRLGLVSDTAYFIVLIFAALWSVSDSPLTPISYVFGSIFGLAYSFGLGKYVETIGGSAFEEGAIEGAGVGQARFAFLIALFIIVGRVPALQEIPAIAGFFTYQLGSLSQGLKEIND